MDFCSAGSVGISTADSDQTCKGERNDYLPEFTGFDNRAFDLHDELHGPHPAGIKVVESGIRHVLGGAAGLSLDRRSIAECHPAIAREMNSWIRSAFYVVLASCTIALTVDLHRLAPKIGAALASVQAIETNTTRTEAEMSGLLNTARHVALDERAAEEKQLAAVDGLAARSAKLLDDADAAVGHLNASAVQLGTIGATTNDAIAGIAADAHDSLLSVNATLGAGQETLKAATADLADPSLKAGIEQVGPAIANLAATSKETAGAAADIHQVTTYEAKQIMAPVSKIKAIALVATRFVGRFFGF
jgi:hypothetical protein